MILVAKRLCSATNLLCTRNHLFSLAVVLLSRRNSFNCWQVKMHSLFGACVSLRLAGVCLHVSDDYHKSTWHFVVSCISLAKNDATCNCWCLFTKKDRQVNKQWQWQMNKLSQLFARTVFATAHTVFSADTKLCIRTKFSQIY